MELAGDTSGALLRHLAVHSTQCAFDYVAPVPKHDFGNMTSGNGGMVKLSHTGFDANDNVVEKHIVGLLA